MEYKLKINSETFPVTVENEELRKLTISLNGKTYDVSCKRISDYHLYLDIDGKGINAYVDCNGGSKAVLVNGISYLVEDVEKFERKKSTVKDAPQSITPPMPSVVIKILVGNGDRIKQDDSVVVVSAMKLETTLRAPFSGIIKSINVSEGDKVMPGQVLVEIEKDDNKEEGAVDG